jgi:hypothetical protein
MRLSPEDSAEIRHLRQLVNCFWCGRVHRADHPLSVCPTCVGRFRTMGLLEMQGSYALDAQTIDEVMPHTSPGNYALGYMNGGVFEVFYVGRSDVDVRRRLHQWVGMPTPGTRHDAFSKAAWSIRSRRAFPFHAPALGPVVHGDGTYTRFAFNYAHSASAAFERECRNYDDFGGSHQLDNERPPAEPPHRAARSARAGGVR